MTCVCTHRCEQDPPAAPSCPQQLFLYMLRVSSDVRGWAHAGSAMRLSTGGNCQWQCPVAKTAHNQTSVPLHTLLILPHTCHFQESFAVACRSRSDGSQLDPHLIAATAPDPQSWQERSGYETSTSGYPSSLEPGLRGGVLPHIRIRSFSAFSAFDQTSPQRSPPSGSPSSTSDRTASVGGPTAHGIASADSYVQLRRVTNKPPKPQDRGGRLGAAWSATRLFRRPLERQVLLVIVCGMLVGCVLHAVVYWRGMVALGRHPSNALAVPLGAQSLNARAIQRRIASGGRVRDGPERPSALDSGSIPLGMPGDSDRLPDTPTWDADAWARANPGKVKVSPDSAAWPNTMAICAMMKNEHPDDVVQWLRYHKCATAAHLSKRLPCLPDQLYFFLGIC